MHTLPGGHSYFNVDFKNSFVNATYIKMLIDYASVCRDNLQQIKDAHADSSRARAILLVS